MNLDLLMVEYQGFYFKGGIQVIENSFQHKGRERLKELTIKKKMSGNLMKQFRHPKNIKL